MLIIDIKYCINVPPFSRIMKEGGVIELKCEKETRNQIINLFNGKQNFRGDIYLNNVSLKFQKEKFIQNIEIVQVDKSIESSLTAEEYLNFHTIIRHCYNENYKKQMEKTLAYFKFQDILKSPMSAISEVERELFRYIIVFLGNTKLCIIDNFQLEKYQPYINKLRVLYQEYLKRGNYVIILSDTSSEPLIDDQRVVFHLER